MMGWLIPVLELLPKLPSIIEALKHAFDHAPTEGLSEEQLAVHTEVKGLVESAHCTVCKK